MKISNNHTRNSKAYVAVKVNNKKYHIYPANWTVDKSKLYYVANKLKAGKIEVPNNANEYYETTIVYVTIDNKLVGAEL